MKDSIKAALTEAATLYGKPRAGHLTPDNNLFPQQLNIKKYINFYEDGLGLARCSTSWEAHFYHKETREKEGLIIKIGKEAEEFYTDIKGFRHLDKESKRELAEEIEEIERNWDNKNAHIKTNNIKDARNIKRSLRR